MTNKLRDAQFAKVIAVCFCLGMLVLFTGCATKPETEKADPMSVIKNAEGLGKALGCIFGCHKSSKDKSSQSK